MSSSTAPPVVAGPPSTARLGARNGARLALLALLIVLVGATVAFGAATLTTPVYAARADLLYPLGTERPTGFLREDRSLTTQTELLSSRAVLAPVGRELGLPPENLERAFTAEVVDGTEFLRLEYRDPSRERGVEALDAIIRQYVVLTDGGAQEEERGYLEAQLSETREVLSDPEAPLGQREAVALRQVSLLDQLDAIELDSSPARVLVDTYSTGEPVSPRPLFAAATGALSAAAVAVVAVALIARRWTRARD